jgi:hypothetical protein
MSVSHASLNLEIYMSVQPFKIDNPTRNLRIQTLFMKSCDRASRLTKFGVLLPKIIYNSAKKAQYALWVSTNCRQRSDGLNDI